MAHILVAEDDQLISGSLCEGLKTAGHTPAPVYDGEAAVEYAKQNHPDLILLDIMMPKLDGVGALWEIKADPTLNKTPVIVLTNMGDADTISKIIEAGAADYLLKSDQSIDQVIKKVDEVLARDVRVS